MTKAIWKICDVQFSNLRLGHKESGETILRIILRVSNPADMRYLATLISILLLVSPIRNAFYEISLIYNVRARVIKCFIACAQTSQTVSEKRSLE